MVLPTLHSYSALKDLTTPQQIIQTKQDTEIEKKVERAPTRLNSGYSKWVSPISGILSDEALRIEQEKQEKSKRLEQRRSHLSTILETEKTKFQNELISTRQSSRESIPKMTARVDSLRSTREKERQAITDEKLHEHSIANNSDVRSIEQQNLENIHSEYWLEELNEKSLVQQEEDLYQRLDDHDRQDGRQKRIEELKHILQQQMNEIQLKEKELELFKQEEEHLLKEQYQLEQYQEERKQMEKRYAPQDNGRQLLRQHKAKLHKRAKEIQEQLELDIKILTFISHPDEETSLEQSENRKQLTRNTLQMLKQFEQQMILEKQKEQEFDAMYPDEAAKQWSPREQEWNHEKESREKLIHQVIDEKQEQLIDELQLLKEQQQQTYEKQRALITDMEQARKYNLIEKQKQEKERQQISIREQQQRTQSRLELEKQDAIERQSNQLIEKQKTIIPDTSLQPKFHGRRRVNWN